MKNLRFSLLITVFTAMIFAFGSCTDDPCDGVDCGANGVPIEDVVFGNCTCNCDTGFEVGPNGDCVAAGPGACEGVDCGLFGTATETTDGADCFCVCEEGYNNDAGMGCVPDCDESNCVNGDCVDGTCDCEDGYEGETCETLTVSKFIGTWTSTEVCVAMDEMPGVCESFEDSYTFEITENGTSTENVILNNYFGVDGEGDAFFPSLVADVDGDEITVTIQASDSPFYNYQSSGTGTYALDDDGNQTVSYEFLVNELDDAGSTTCTVNCTATWTKN